MGQAIFSSAGRRKYESYFRRSPHRRKCCLFSSVLLSSLFISHLSLRRPVLPPLVLPIPSPPPRSSPPPESRSRLVPAGPDPDPHPVRAQRHESRVVSSLSLLASDWVGDGLVESRAWLGSSAERPIFPPAAQSGRVVAVGSCRRRRGAERPIYQSAVFKKLLPSERDFERAFRIVEAELGFCYDFFFTKYYYTFVITNLLPVPFLQSLALAKITLILTVGVFAVRNSLLLETPNPIIQVRISRADYIITLLLLGIALVVELVHAAFYLASDWAQVSLATMYVKRYWYEISPSIFGTLIAFLRRVTFSGQLMRNRMKQHSLMRNRIKQQDPVEVSDAVKRAVARSLISTYGGKEDDAVETSQWQELKGLSQLEVMLIWHVATEHCDISSGPAPTNRTITPRDDDRGVAIHLSRYCAYLIGSVPELLPSEPHLYQSSEGSSFLNPICIKVF